MKVLKKIEAKELFHHSLYIGAALLLAVGINTIVIRGIYFFGENFGIARYDMHTILTSPQVGLWVNSAVLILCLTLPFLFVPKHFGMKIAQAARFNMPVKNNAMLTALFVLGICMAANVLTAILSFVLLHFFGIRASAPALFDFSAGNAYEFAYLLITVAAVPALVEEFAFRGVILGVLRRFGTPPAILISSIAFALFHGNFRQIPFAFVAGLGLGAAVVITDSIWPAVLAHFFNNTFAIVGNIQPQIFVSGLFTFVILGIVCFLILLKREDFAAMRDKPSALSNKNKVLLLLSAPTMLLFIFLLLHTAVSRLG